MAGVCHAKIRGYAKRLDFLIALQIPSLTINEVVPKPIQKTFSYLYEITIITKPQIH
jgi:hypothetical protein